ncbi:MAG: response regulator transcription factor [Dehalococcoidia bacterium]
MLTQATLQPEATETARVAVVSRDVSIRYGLGQRVSDLGAIPITISPDDVAEFIAPGVILVLLDMREGGATVLAFIRSRTEATIVGVVEHDQPNQATTALGVGADDVLEWPAHPEIIRVRIQAILRRLLRGSVLIGPGGLELLPRAHEVKVRGVSVDLTPREFEILEFLLERRGEVIGSEALANHLWGHPTYGVRNFVEAHISRIRAKLRTGGAEDVIKTLRGVGYKVPL